MSSNHTNYFSKENLDEYLKELAKEYRKMGGKQMPAEIILTGGAAIIANYGFRNTTTDVDAVIQAASIMKDAINSVGDKLSLSNGWLNADVTRSESYTPKLVQHCEHYKEFYGVLNVRTVSSEYLIAMKLRSGRTFKHDLSDIIGILAEHEKHGVPITYAKIDKAINNLYGGWDTIPLNSKTFIKNALQMGNYEKIYEEIKNEEALNSSLLKKYSNAHPGVLNAANTEAILRNLKSSSTTPSSTPAPKQAVHLCRALFKNQKTQKEVEVFLDIIPQNYTGNSGGVFLTAEENVQALNKLKTLIKDESTSNYTLQLVEMDSPPRQRPSQTKKLSKKQKINKTTPR